MFLAIVMNIAINSVLLIFYTEKSVRQSIAALFILFATLDGVIYAVAHIV